MNTFSIHHQLTFKDYRKIYFTLLYSKVWMILIPVAALLLILSDVTFRVTKNYDVLGNDYYQFALTVIPFVAIWTPLVSLYQVRRNFKSTYKLSEPTTYEFSDEGYTATGVSFNSNSDWAKVYKVQIIKGWLVLYHSRHAANMVKIELNNEGNIEVLKQFLKAGSFKAKLKW